MNTLWQEEESEQICSREFLTEEAAEFEKTISVKEHKRNTMISTRQCFVKKNCKQRPDGVAINKNHRTLCILKLKRSSNRNEDFLGVKQAL